jgi:iron complex outermembrane receptor protein
LIWRASQAAVPNADPRWLSSTVVAPVERYSVMLTGAYDVWDNVEAYGELSFSRRDSYQERWRQLFPNVSGTNPNNLVAAGGFGVLARSIVMVPTNAEQQVDYYRGVAGIRGDLGWDSSPFAGWGYDLYFQHIRSEADYTNDIIYNDRVNATVAAGTACNQALITISGGNCADVPTGIRWFDDAVVTSGAFTQAESDFLFTRETGHTTYAQTLINGSITGDLFELPAGPVAMALGFEWRKDELDDTPGFNARNNNLWGQTSAGRTAGSDTVKEFFTEVSVPVFAGMFMVEDLTIDGSWRWTDYDSYGEDTTYKVGLNWRVTPEFRIRATKGTSFRAPALFEIFLANQTGFLSQLSVDPCINWDSSANPNIVTNCGGIGGVPGGFTAGYIGPYSSALILTGGGGPGVLNAENSEASTIGVIFTPDWIDLSVAIDYWTFQVDDQVATFGAFNIVNACYTADDFPTNPFCSLFVRDEDPLSVEFGKIISVNNAYVNIANQHTEGMDLTVRYRHEFPWFDFTGTTQATWTFTDQIQTLPTSPVNDFNGELYDSDFVANVDLRFDRDNWTFFWNIDMASRTSNDEAFGGQVFLWRGTPFAGRYKQWTEFSAVHDMSLRYRGDNWSIIGGMQNVFDEAPPAISTASGFGRFGNAVATGGPYDLLGRRVFFEVVKSF